MTTWMTAAHLNDLYENPSVIFILQFVIEA